MKLFKPIQDMLDKRTEQMKEERRLAEIKRKVDFELIIQKNLAEKAEQERVEIENSFPPDLYMVQVNLPLEITVDEKGYIHAKLRLTNAMQYDFNKEQHYNVEKDLCLLLVKQYIMEEITRRAKAERAAQNIQKIA